MADPLTKVLPQLVSDYRPGAAGPNFNRIIEENTTRNELGVKASNVAIYQYAKFGLVIRLSYLIILARQALSQERIYKS